MRIGIGGGFGPVRAGMSNKGFGGGVGPVSAGESWKSSKNKKDDSSGSAVGIVILLGICWFIISSPYLLGTWVAVQLGAANPSSIRSWTGWTFEILAVAAAVWICLRMWRRRQQENLRMQRLRQQEDAEASARMRRYEEKRSEAQTALLNLRSAMTQRQPRPLSSRGQLTWSEDVPQHETLLYIMSDLTLRTHPLDVPRSGQMAFTSESILIHSEGNTQILEAELVIGMASTESGYLHLRSVQVPGGLLIDGGSDTSNQIIQVLIEWSTALATGTSVSQETFDLLDSVVTSF